MEAWVCTSCSAKNKASSEEGAPRCRRCRTVRPQHEIEAQALAQTQQQIDASWAEALDPASSQVYYYNAVTGVTCWDRPDAMGPAPFSTGWFGRGAAEESASTRYTELETLLRSRPALKQVEDERHKSVLADTSGEYNLWYHKYTGDRERVKATPATTRCVPERDGGTTRANGAKGRCHFCIYFAKGCCSKGAECTFHHRIPTPQDDAHNGARTDIFGRERHVDHREDMGGVGSINDPSRTLYVGGLALSLKKTEGWSAKAAVYTAFAEFGEVENINVIDRLSIAFVRYRYRSSTEFAREAMTNQSLGNGEMLNTRWAHDDPNPKAMLASERANLQMVVERVIAVDRSRSSQREDQEQAAAAGAAAAAAAAAPSAGGAAASGGGGGGAAAVGAAGYGAAAASAVGVAVAAAAIASAGSKRKRSDGAAATAEALAAASSAKR